MPDEDDPRGTGGGGQAPAVSMHRARRAKNPTSKAPERRPFPGKQFHLPTPYPREAYVDITGFSRPLLAEQVARIIYHDHHDGIDFRSHGVVGHALATLRRLEEYLAVADPEGRVRSLHDVEPWHIDGFDEWAHGAWTAGSTMPYAHLSRLIRLMERAIEHRFARPGLAARLTHVSKHHRCVDTTPRDAYPPIVMQQLREGARCAVERTIARMAPAFEIAPGRAGEELSNGEAVVRHLRHVGFISQGQKQLGKSLRRRGEPTLATLFDQVFPGIADLVPFALLIADDCGLPPESIQELGRDCMTTLEEDFGLGTISHIKRRRDPSGVKSEEPVRTKQRWSTGWLVGEVLRLTATTRKWLVAGKDLEESKTQEADEEETGDDAAMEAVRDEDRLFVARVGTRLKAVHLNNLAFKAHLDRFPVFLPDGKPLETIELSRIRKSFKGALYEKVGGDLARIGEDHTRDVFGTRYARISSLAGTHERTVAAGLEAGLEGVAVEAGATTVLDAVGARRLEDDAEGIALELGRDVEKVRAAADDGPNEVWLAGCLDFDDSPFANGARGCGAPIWGCLDCRNAVVTPAKLPTLLRLLEHLRQQRQEMDLATFQRRLGLPFLRVQQIIGRFTAAEVDAARLAAADDFNRTWTLEHLTYRI